MKRTEIGDRAVWCRDAGDEAIMREVLQKRIYRKVRRGFDVEPGEHWLDLGANVGAFAVYCKIHGARATCYEPDPGCFRVLKRNARGFTLHMAAVTDIATEALLPFQANRDPGNHSRGTVLRVNNYVDAGMVANVYAGTIEHQVFDGVKMDIEGSEGPLIDGWLIPRCQKLVMEYHTSRDPSVAHLKKRLAILRRRFRHVDYPAEYDRAITSGNKTFKSFFDRMIFAWEPRT